MYFSHDPVKKGGTNPGKGMIKTSPFEFMRLVRQEIDKVTWPTRKETIVTSIMVCVMVFVCAVFFLCVDRVLSWGVSLVLGLGA